MAVPGTAQKFADALKAHGVKVVEVKGWKTNNRNSKGSWGPVHGVMMHHTAGVSAGIVDYCFDGTDALPGPLSHGVITKDGTVHLIGWGRANHAGGGDPDVLAAVKAGRTPLPKTNEHQGSDGSVDGNAHFIGFECVNKGDGTDTWPAVQIEAMVRTAAAVCDLYGWSARSVIRHMDWTDYKSDPRGIDWADFVKRVQKRLDGPVTAPKPPTAPKPEALPVVSLKHVVAAAKRDPGLPDGGTTHKAEVLLVERALVLLGYLNKDWADGSFGTKTKDAYRALQRHLGYVDNAADGVPGAHSLTWLGLKSKLFRKGA